MFVILLIGSAFIGLAQVVNHYLYSVALRHHAMHSEKKESSTEEISGNIEEAPLLKEENKDENKEEIKDENKENKI